MPNTEINPRRQYVIICPDKDTKLELQKAWRGFLCGETRAIFLNDDVAVVPVEQVAGFTTWEEVAGKPPPY